MNSNPYTPKTREEFEAYCRAMDEANEAIVKAAAGQDQTTQARHPTEPIAIDEDAESWATLMMGLAAAKEQPHLRKDFEERVSREVLRAADECSSYDDFKRRLARYQKEEVH